MLAVVDRMERFGGFIILGGWDRVGGGSISLPLPLQIFFSLHSFLSMLQLVNKVKHPNYDLMIFHWGGVYEGCAEWTGSGEQ